ncbi:MAG: response regulator [Ktedonobacteraceae bacterium]|nr:response regulator [Ktedonobacteraceae bacterium]
MAKIIFCEDEKRIQKLISIMLRASEHEISIASDGVEGMELIERERPDLIFADVSMPNCDGFQLAAQLKSVPHLAHIPIIFMSAFAQHSEIQEGYRHGAASYLIKPFNLVDLQAQMKLFLLPGHAST